MERLYYSGKFYLFNLRLYYCCWLAPVRIGLFIIGYLTIAVDLLFMMGIVAETLEPTVFVVQNELIQNVSKPIPVAAYAIELGFNVVLLCGLHNKDLVLVQVFFYYTIFALLLSFMTYSMVLAAVTLRTKLAIIFSTLFQIYCILLVRSEIVSMKINRKKYEYSLLTISGNTSPTLSYKYPKTNIYDNETRIVLIDNENKKDIEMTEIKYDPKYIVEQDVKEKDTKIIHSKEETQKEAEFNVGIESWEAKEKRLKEERKAEQKRIQEIMKLDEKRMKIAKKAEENRMKEEKKAERKIKEENKREEKRLKELKKEGENKIKSEKKAEEKRIKDEKKNKQTVDKDVCVEKETNIPKIDTENENLNE